MTPGPPPMALSSERVLLSALLTGDVVTTDLGGFDSDAICEPLLRRTYETVVALRTVDLNEITSHLKRRAVVGPAKRALLDVRDTTPSYPRSLVLAAADRLMDLWRQRQLLRVMGEVGADIRAGRLDHRGARDRLRAHFRSVQR